MEGIGTTPGTEEVEPRREQWSRVESGTETESNAGRIYRRPNPNSAFIFHGLSQKINLSLFSFTSARRSRATRSRPQTMPS